MLLKDTIVEGLLDGKANDVVCLDMENIDGSICDYFVIGHGILPLILKESIGLFTKNA